CARVEGGWNFGIQALIALPPEGEGTGHARLYQRVSQRAPGGLRPDDVRILVAAFEKAWASVEASGAAVNTESKAASARAILAKHIIAAATQGERDQGRLRDGAVLAFAQANLRTAPRRRRPPSARLAGKRSAHETAGR